MTVSLRQNIPAGKTRVIVVDLFSHEEHLVKDCDTQKEAFQIADDHNRKREGSMDSVYYVYNDKGNYLRGEEAIKDADGMTAVGVSP